MYVQEFIDLCESTVLKQLEHIDDLEVLGFLNKALVQVFKRFDLNLVDQTFNIVTNQFEYPINDDYLIWISAHTPEKFLRDINGDIIPGGKNDERSIPVNDPDDKNSIQITTVRNLKVKYDTNGQTIRLRYRAAPALILANETDTLMPVEPQYIEPLMHYVGYLGYLGLNIIGGESDNLLGQFNLACNQIEQYGTAPHNQHLNTKLTDRGYI